MEWSEVLDPEVKPEEFICEKVPAIHKARLEQFRRFASTPLIFSIHFTDVDERYTLQLDGDEARGEPGEMIDFPQATARGLASEWARAMKLASILVEPADEQIQRMDGRAEVTEDIKEKFARFDGLLEVEITELPDGGPLKFEVVLNDYDSPPRAPKAKLIVAWPLLVSLAHGEINPVAAARQVVLRGAMGLALELGGFFAQEFDL